MEIKSVPLSIPPDAAAILQIKAHKAFPYEICGVVRKDNSISEFPNGADDETHSFKMEIDQDDDNIACVWHSHPRGPAWPSFHDIPCMEAAAKAGFKFTWLIVMPGAVYEYKVEQDGA